MVALAIQTIRKNKHLKIEIARRTSAEQTILRSGFIDHLTNLPNKISFDHYLAEILLNTDKVHRAAICLVNIREFRIVNERHGYKTGDQALIEIAQRLRYLENKNTKVFRTNGDEYCVIFDDMRDVNNVHVLAGRIQECFTARFQAGKETISLAAAVGIAIAPDSGNSIEDLFRRADIALFKSRTNSDAPYSIFTSEMDSELREHEFIEFELPIAILNGSLQPHYQPIIDLKTARITAFEALARWTHPTKGFISPQLFIDVAEKKGLIWPLTEQLFRQACRDAKTWPADTRLSFNLSPLQLADPAIGLKVVAIIEEEGFDPRQLDLEITENVPVKTLIAAHEILQFLKNVGIRIVLDDFGTGQTSLQHLKACQFDKLKIDRSFISTMRTSRESSEIVRAIIGISVGLGIKTTAEGIELDSEVAMLQQSGCHEGQGWLFSKAVPANKACDLAWLSHRENTTAEDLLAVVAI